MSLYNNLADILLRATGIHIGNRKLTNSMRSYVAKNENGINILSMEKILNKINVAGKLIARTIPNVVVISNEPYAFQAISKFSEIVNAQTIIARYIPGTFSNSILTNHINPELVILSRPGYIDEKEKIIGNYTALQDAINERIPIIALCDTDDDTSFIDLVIPCNNRSPKAIATAFYLLTRATLFHTNIPLSSWPRFQLTEFETTTEELVVR
jgi:ribosomal protein uS2